MALRFFMATIIILSLTAISITSIILIARKLFEGSVAKGELKKRDELFKIYEKIRKNKKKMDERTRSGDLVHFRVRDSDQSNNEETDTTRMPKL